jgi:hypothetical protein
MAPALVAAVQALGGVAAGRVLAPRHAADGGRVHRRGPACTHRAPPPR